MRRIAVNRWVCLFAIVCLSIIPRSCFSATSQPKISVIVFVDQWASPEKMLDELSKQRCAQDLELILIDFGYSNCSSIFSNSSFKLRSRCFTMRSDYNKSLTLNAIIANCHGEYIFTLVGGDTLNPEILQEYLNAFENDPNLDMIYADVCVRYDGYTPIEDASNWYRVNKPEYVRNLLYYDLPGRQCIWRKNLVTRFGQFDTSYNYLHMLEFWNRCANNGAQYKKIDTLSGICFLPYGCTWRNFNSHEEHDQYTQESERLYQTYCANWKKPTKSCPDKKSFVIITASYNNKDWYKRNLNSLFNQNYDNYRIIYIDDASPDGTGHLVQSYMQECHQEDRMTLIRNETRQGAVANIYKAGHMCQPEEIILIVDGDDWLVHDGVLNRLNEIYQDPNVWATYGQFLWFPYSLEGFAYETPSYIIEQNNFRGTAWNVTHLRTYYAAVYQKIKKEDLMYGDRFYPMTGDLAVTYPVMEMCGTHSAFVPDVIYIYNSENSINDNKVNIELQGQCGHDILCRPPYQPLESLFA